VTGRRQGAVVGLLVMLIQVITLILVAAILVVRTMWVVAATEIRHHRARKARTMYEWTKSAPPCSTWYVPLAAEPPSNR
jgi:hypothetical protein